MEILVITFQAVVALLGIGVLGFWIIGRHRVSAETLVFLATLSIDIAVPCLVLASLIVDFSHSMRRILACDQETARVQPGVVCALLNRFLAERGRIFGPAPATAHVSTMGSVAAVARST